MAEASEDPARAMRLRPPGGKKKIRDHHDLRVWRKASKLAGQCRTTAASFPSTQAKLAGVIPRLAEEVAHEIAMGQAQGLYAAYQSHLETARTALRHLERRLIEAHKNHCLVEAVGDPLLAQAAEIDRMLRKLMVSLELAHARSRARGRGEA